MDTVPQRKGEPYLWQAFILDLHDGGLCISVIDRPDCSALLQAIAAVRRFAQCRQSVGERLSLVVAVDSDARRRLYAKAVKHAKLQEHAQGTAEPVSMYRVNLPLPSIHFTTHESNTHTDNLIRGGHHETDRHNPEVLGRKVNSGNKETYVSNLLVLDPDNSTGTNYAVEVWGDKPHDLRLMSDVSLTVIGVVNKNTGVPAFRAVIGPRPEAEEAPAAA